MTSMISRPIVKLMHVQCMRYNEVLDTQKQMMKTLQNAVEISGKRYDDLPNQLLLVEHLPVYTTGIRSKEYDTNIEAKLTKLGAEFVRTNRGGLITFHGKGQLVVYPIIHMRSFGAITGIKSYVCLIERTIIDLCKAIGISSHRIDGLPGIWVENERKLAAIGVSASKFVTMHGFAINCNVELKWYDHIIPCGIPDKKVTSLSNELNRDVTIGEVTPHLLRCFSETFNCHIE